jgi:hypothetical protein
VSLDAIVNYELPAEEIVARLSGRRTCLRCKAVYHVITRPPFVKGVCDQCGIGLVRREDDRPESVRLRMQAYQASTQPLTEYYSRTGKLVMIQASGTPAEILERTLAAVGIFTLELKPLSWGTGRRDAEAHGVPVVALVDCPDRQRPEAYREGSAAKHAGCMGVPERAIGVNVGDGLHETHRGREAEVVSLAGHD